MMLTVFPVCGSLLPQTVQPVRRNPRAGRAVAVTVSPFSYVSGSVASPLMVTVPALAGSALALAFRCTTSIAMIPHSFAGPVEVPRRCASRGPRRS